MGVGVSGAVRMDLSVEGNRGQFLVEATEYSASVNVKNLE